jgi:hypothetical protein
MKTLSKLKPLGVILEQAGLVALPQIEVALRDQAYCSNLLIGEILALRGWIKQETADFFAQELPALIQQEKTEPIGQYFKRAALLDDIQIQDILAAQKQGQTWIRFGALAVFKGYIKQSTLDFFLEYLVRDFRADSTFTTQRKQRRSLEEEFDFAFAYQTINSDSFRAKPKARISENEEIPWID